jgi:hypothetical protein
MMMDSGMFRQATQTRTGTPQQQQLEQIKSFISRMLFMIGLMMLILMIVS